MFFNSFFSFHNAIIQSFVAGTITFLVTVLGSSFIFFFKSVHKNLMNSMLSLSAGIMLAASFFSLLNPAIKLSNELISDFVVSDSICIISSYFGISIPRCFAAYIIYINILFMIYSYFI